MVRLVNRLHPEGRAIVGLRSSSVKSATLEWLETKSEP